MEFCQICLENVSIDLMLTISCGCKACVDCHRNWAISQIKDEKTYIRCPFLQCGLMLSGIEEFLTPDLIEKLQYNQVSKYLRFNNSIHMCPKPGCGYSGFVIKDTQRDFYCEKCCECWLEPKENFALGIYKIRAVFE